MLDTMDRNDIFSVVSSWQGVEKLLHRSDSSSKTGPQLSEPVCHVCTALVRLFFSSLGLRLVFAKTCR